MEPRQANQNSLVAKYQLRAFSKVSANHAQVIGSENSVGPDVSLIDLEQHTQYLISRLDAEPWIQSPALPEDLRIKDLSPEFISGTLNYLIVSGERLAQMTKTYDDIDVVIRLLQEKGVDLELAARIGQGLLEQNKELRETIKYLQSELSERQEELQQLKRELLSKESLLRTLIDEQEEQECQQRLKYNEVVRQLADTERRVVEIVAENEVLKKALRNLTSSSLSSDTTQTTIKSNELLECLSSPELTPTRAAGQPKPLKAVSPYKIESNQRAIDFIDETGEGTSRATAKIQPLDLTILPESSLSKQLVTENPRPSTFTPLNHSPSKRRPPKLESSDRAGLASVLCTTDNLVGPSNGKVIAASAAVAMRAYSLAKFSRSGVAGEAQNKFYLKPEFSQIVLASPSASTSSSLIFGVLVILMCCFSPKRGFEVNIGPRLDSLCDLTLD